MIRTDIAVLFVGDDAERQALLLGEPDLFFSAPGYENAPLVLVRLARVDVDRLTELVTDAWRMRAPEGLLEDGADASARPGARLTLGRPGGASGGRCSGRHEVGREALRRDGRPTEPEEGPKRDELVGGARREVGEHL